MLQVSTEYIQQPMLDKKQVKKQGQLIMQHHGVPEQGAKSRAEQVCNDMAMATSYVLPIDISFPKKDEMPTVIREWIKTFQSIDVHQQSR